MMDIGTLHIRMALSGWILKLYSEKYKQIA